MKNNNNSDIIIKWNFVLSETSLKCGGKMKENFVIS